MANFTSAFTVNDSVFILTDVGAAKQTTVTGIGFRTGTNFAAFNANTDFIYTFAEPDAEGNPIQRPQNLTFANKDAIKAYIDTV